MSKIKGIFIQITEKTKGIFIEIIEKVKDLYNISFCQYGWNPLDV